MKTNVKKAVAVFSAATILMGVPCVHAEGGDNFVNSAGTGVIMPRYTAIVTHTNNLSATNAGTLTCFGKTTVNYPYVASIKVELKENGTTIRTWTSDGGISASVNKTYQASQGNTYVLRVTYSAYDASGNLIESVVGYSNEVIYN